jgi:hypothetical protein
MSYEEKLTCKKKKCRGSAASALTVPLKLIQKGAKVLDVSRCPQCHETYKNILKTADKEEWIPLVGKPFFTCDVCGTLNDDNYQLTSGGRFKIVTTCKNCGKKRAKIISQELWNDVVAQIKKPEEAPIPEFSCPHCGAAVSEDAKVCPSCSKEILCNKCGARIAPGAGFCSECGDKVEEIKAPAPSPPKENVCPSCNESYEPGSKFCSLCGQELVCNKCGAAILEGASFCTACGDPVQKGDLAE